MLWHLGLFGHFCNTPPGYVVAASTPYENGADRRGYPPGYDLRPGRLGMESAAGADGDGGYGLLT